MYQTHLLLKYVGAKPTVTRFWNPSLSIVANNLSKGAGILLSSLSAEVELSDLKPRTISSYATKSIVFCVCSDEPGYMR